MRIFPFRVVHFVLMLLQVADSTRVRAYGPGLESATTNEPTTFTIETKGAGQGSLGLAIEGPSEAKMVCKDNQDGTCLMEYLPVRNERKKSLNFELYFFRLQIKAGQYDIAIKFAEQHVPGRFVVCLHS